MFTRVAKAALAAGLVAGLTVSVMQSWTTTPMIMKAETFEVTAQATPAQSQLTAGILTIAGNHAHNHTHSGGHTHGDGWTPADGVERTAYTSVSAVGTAFGFALILLALMILANTKINARNGLMWGVAAFTAAGLAPAFGLSPELPGAAAADVASRQIWWLGTVLATGAALYLMLRISTPVAIAVGIVLMLAPHLIGAPSPHQFSSAVPAELSADFAAASMVLQAMTWALVGTIAGFTFERLEMRSAVA